jgi:hypothetical protein
LVVVSHIKYCFNILQNTQCKLEHGRSSLMTWLGMSLIFIICMIIYLFNNIFSESCTQCILKIEMKMTQSHALELFRHKHRYNCDSLAWIFVFENSQKWTNRIPNKMTNNKQEVIFDTLADSYPRNSLFHKSHIFLSLWKTQCFIWFFKIKIQSLLWLCFAAWISWAQILLLFLIMVVYFIVSRRSAATFFHWFLSFHNLQFVMRNEL